MECSLAIKCPSIHYHLAGTKKVQQALAQPEMLERFISDPEEVNINYLSSPNQNKISLFLIID